MDTPTHGLVGRLAARALWPEKTNTGLVNVVTVCSLLPDLDVFMPGDGLESLVTHRGITHSLLGVAIGALVVAGFAQRVGLKQVPFRRVYGAAVFGFLTHLCFDVVTTYGTLIFAPFFDYRAAIDILFIIDPYLDVLLIGGLLLGWLYRQSMYRWAGGAVVCYVVLGAVITGVGHYQARAWAEAEGIVAERVEVMPTPFSPLHRRAMVIRGERVYWIPMTLFGGAYGQAAEYQFALADRRIEAVWQSRAGQIYNWFARVPVVQVVDGDKLLVQDLQFVARPYGLGWLGSWAAQVAQDHRPGLFERRIFALEIELDGKNNVRQVTYWGQNGERFPL